jgi:hypothetical protein
MNAALVSKSIRSCGDGGGGDDDGGDDDQSQQGNHTLRRQHAK